MPKCSTSPPPWSSQAFRLVYKRRRWLRIVWWGCRWVVLMPDQKPMCSLQSWCCIRIHQNHVLDMWGVVIRRWDLSWSIYPAGAAGVIVISFSLEKQNMITFGSHWGVTHGGPLVPVPHEWDFFFFCRVNMSPQLLSFYFVPWHYSSLKQHHQSKYVLSLLSPRVSLLHNCGMIAISR